MQTMQAPVPSQHLYAIVALAAVAVVFLAMWPKARATAIVDSRCELWDMEASAAIAAMIGSRSELADAQLGDAGLTKVCAAYRSFSLRRHPRREGCCRCVPHLP